VAAPAAGTNPTSRPLSPRERFLEFATRPRFGRWIFQLEDRLGASTLSLRVERSGGRPDVCTPLGLGMTESEARAWVSCLSEVILTNFDAFESYYRTALAPRAVGGPGLSFGQARLAALELTANGGKWQLLEPAQLEAAAKASPVSIAVTDAGASPTPAWRDPPAYEYVPPAESLLDDSSFRIYRPRVEGQGAER